MIISDGKLLYISRNVLQVVVEVVTLLLVIVCVGLSISCLVHAFASDQTQYQTVMDIGVGWFFAVRALASLRLARHIFKNPL